MKLYLCSDEGAAVTVYAAPDGSVSCRQYARAVSLLRDVDGVPSRVERRNGRHVASRPAPAPCPHPITPTCRLNLWRNR